MGYMGLSPTKLWLSNPNKFRDSPEWEEPIRATALVQPHQIANPGADTDPIDVLLHGQLCCRDRRKDHARLRQVK